MKKLIKKSKLILFLIIILLSLFACSEGEGKLEVINRTNYNVYFEIDGKDYIVPGELETGTVNSKKVKLNTGEKRIFGSSSKSYQLRIEGETFKLIKDNSNSSEDLVTTNVEITSDETLKAYCDPNTASLKFINNSDENVVSMTYNTYDQTGLINTCNNCLTEDIEPGEFFFRRVTGSTNENIRYYETIIETESGMLYGTIDTLYNDEQSLIVIE